MARILILTSASGAGHNRVAQALAGALSSRGNGAVHVAIADPFTGADFPSRITRLYGVAITRAPWLWGLLYRISDSPRLEPVLASPLERVVGRLLAGERPDLIISVHPMCHGAALRALRRMEADIPVAVQVTELLDVHAAWQTPEASLLLCPTAEAAGQVVARGFPGERIRVLGLPVHQGFRSGSGHDGQKGSLRLRLGLDPDKPTIMLTGGGEGAGPLEPAVRTVARALPEAQMVVVCGRNESLRRRLARARLPGRVLGFVDGMPAWMQACDVVVAKAGAVTVAEAVAARRPLLIMRALPGQEQGNLRFVVQSEIGAHAPPGAPLAGALHFLDAQAFQPARWLANMAQVDRPDAQDQAADLLLEIVTRNRAR